MGHQTAVAGGGLLRSGAGWLLGGQADLLCCFLMAIKKGDFNVSRGTVALRPWPPACRPWSGRAEARAGRRVTLRGRRVYGGLVTRRPDSCPAPCPGGPSPLPLRWPTAPYTGSLPSSEGVRNAFDLMLRTETPPVGGSVRGGFAIRMQDKPHGSAGHEGGGQGREAVGTGRSAWNGPTNMSVSGSDCLFCVHSSLEVGRQTGAGEEKGHRRDPPPGTPMPGPCLKQRQVAGWGEGQWRKCVTKACTNCVTKALEVTSVHRHGRSPVGDAFSLAVTKKSLALRGLPTLCLSRS